MNNSPITTVTSSSVSFFEKLKYYFNRFVDVCSKKYAWLNLTKLSSRLLPYVFCIAIIFNFYKILLEDKASIFPFLIKPTPKCIKKNISIFNGKLDLIKKDS